MEDTATAKVVLNNTMMIYTTYCVPEELMNRYKTRAKRPTFSFRRKNNPFDFDALHEAEYPSVDLQDTFEDFPLVYEALGNNRPSSAYKLWTDAVRDESAWVVYSVVGFISIVQSLMDESREATASQWSNIPPWWWDSATASRIIAYTTEEIALVFTWIYNALHDRHDNEQRLLAAHYLENYLQFGTQVLFPTEILTAPPSIRCLNDNLLREIRNRNLSLLTVGQ